MKKSLFRPMDRFELFSCYLLCFGFNSLSDYAKTLNIDSFLLRNFLKQVYDYQALIIFLLSFIVVIFHYQMINRKKVELHCRILVGDTIRGAVFRYFVENLIILGIALVFSVLLNVVLNIRLISNIYLFCVFVAYILISSRVVSSFENI